MSTKKKKTLLPKLKIQKIDVAYKKEDKEILKMVILEKNSYIKALVQDGHHFEIMIIDEKYNYGIAKVSPEIREAIMNRGKIYIDMQSHDVRDQIHVIQCFRCQEHGHKNGDDIASSRTLKIPCAYTVQRIMLPKHVHIKRINQNGNAPTVSKAKTPIIDLSVMGILLQAMTVLLLYSKCNQ